MNLRRVMQGDSSLVKVIVFAIFATLLAEWIIFNSLKYLALSNSFIEILLNIILVSFFSFSLLFMLLTRNFRKMLNYYDDENIL